MKRDPATVNDLVLGFQPFSYVRVIPSAQMTMPLGMGFGFSRVSSPGQRFRLVYLARNLATAIAEAIIRDRFEGVSDRVLDATEIENWAVAALSAPAPLTVLDLRTTGLRRLGVSTNAARGKSHDKGRQLSEAVYEA